MALAAQATERSIEVLIADPTATSCQAVSAIGVVPIAYHSYWQLK